MNRDTQRVEIIVSNVRPHVGSNECVFLSTHPESPGIFSHQVMLFFADAATARATGEALMREAWKVEQALKAKAATPTAEEIGLPSLADA